MNSEYSYGAGWKARIGYLAPQAVGESNACQFYRIVPEGISMVYTCLGIHELVASEWEAAHGRLMEGARELARRKVDVIVQAGSPLLVAYPKGEDLRIIEAIEEATGVPAITADTALMEALKLLSVKKLAVASPMGEDLNAMFKLFVEGYGFEVVAIKGLNMPLLEVERQPVTLSYKLAKEAVRAAPEAEGIYLLGNCWMASENIDRLEKELKIPVISAMTALIWKCFNMLHLREPIKGYGRLLESL